MKTIQKNYYVCEICGRTSQNQDKIKECQVSHRRITDECEIEQVYDRGKVEPRLLKITCPDGAEMVFFNSKPL
ncbi:hypothetical protein [Hominifimenecus sp. rT4P-3]|uniref:hypothetical protein n=1 Tax=Hominifimenecus sp. rT4P-3 TaxID=3242979 RepID=UPI003DA2B407